MIECLKVIMATGRSRTAARARTHGWRKRPVVLLAKWSSRPRRSKKLAEKEREGTRVRRWWWWWARAKQASKQTTTSVATTYRNM